MTGDAERDRTYLIHMLECAEKVRDYTAEGEDAFMGDPMVQDAVMRNFEVIGEAAKRVSDDLRAEHPDIPWRRIAGFRDVLIHGYMGVDPDEVWGVVEEHLDELIEDLRAILMEHGRNKEP